MSLKNKSVLVTGGAGFIGSHLVDQLINQKPDKIVIVDDFFLGKETNLQTAKKNYPELKVYKQDAADYNAMQMIMENENIDVVFNLAVIPLPASLTKPRWGFEKNVQITMTICELARNNLFKTLIHFSSSEVYGTSEYAPMDESHPLNGTTTYAASKSASDLLIFSYCRTYGIDSSIIRPFNNYGPRQNEKSYAGVIPITIKRIMNGEAPIIYGDGKQTRDYLFVTDTAKAAIKVHDVKATRNKVLNVASGVEISIEKLVQSLSEILVCDKKIIYEAERPGDVRRHIANIYLAKDLIGFGPTISFEDGLRTTVEWYKQIFQG
jgi:UDP-glucose 4-epimerase